MKKIIVTILLIPTLLSSASCACGSSSGDNSCPDSKPDTGTC